ncbi:DUF192 domain-containing protein [Acetobacterium sp.]|uniref:DUF192 domain-containing protein n=1 Tax=Acetobacterium sp. TaxID=1872094 RepID=UPI002F41BE83
MKICRVLKNEVVLANQIRVADHFIQKLVGLLKDKGLNCEQGLLLSGCKQVHTIGMRFPIDVIFMSKEGEILHIENDMSSGKVSKYVKRAFYTLELKAGAAKEHNLLIHDHITFEILSINEDGK